MQITLEKIDQVLDNLKNKYESFINAGEKPFFLGVAEYVHLASDHPVTSIFLQELLDERLATQQKVDAAATKAQQELDDIFEKVDQEIERPSAELANELGEYRDLQSGRIWNSNGPVRARQMALGDIFYLLEKEKPELAKRYAKLTVRGEIEERFTSPLFDEYDDLKKQFDRELEISNWGSWNNMVLAFKSAYQAKEMEKAHAGPDKHFMDKLNVGLLIGEMKKILEEKPDRRVHFEKEEYRTDVSRVHHWLMNELSKMTFTVEDADHAELEKKKPAQSPAEQPASLYSAAPKPLDWGWLSEKDHTYQFGKEKFKQPGKVRGVVFCALMNVFEKNAAISVGTLHEITGLNARRLRIEIAAISKRLEGELGYYFKGSHQGFYTIEKQN